jgi:hypothetical protein
MFVMGRPPNFIYFAIGRWRGNKWRMVASPVVNAGFFQKASRIELARRVR